MRRFGIIALLAGSVAGCAALWSGPPPPAIADLPGDADRGARLGRKYCTSCHGPGGDGAGEAASGLGPAPRSFVRGLYRYRSTPGGELPTDADLARVIRVGLPGTSMPGFGRALDDRDVADLVAWMKRFRPGFDDAPPPTPLAVPTAPPATPASVERGRALYAQLQCGLCHGDQGSGDGWLAKAGLRDALGRRSKARDLRRDPFRGGGRAEDVYRTLVTGMDGSPMPGYAALPPGDVYALVHYIGSLRRDRGLWPWLSRAPHWNNPRPAELE